MVALFGLLWTATSSFSQDSEFKAIDSLIKARETEEATQILNQVDTTQLDASENARYYLLTAQLHSLKNNADDSYQNFLIAKKKYTALDSLEQAAKINLQIIPLLTSSRNKDLDPQPYMDEYLEYAREKNDPAMLAKAYMQLGTIFINTDVQRTIQYYKQAKRENLKTGDSLMNAKIHHNLGVAFGEMTPEKDSAMYHYEIALKEYKKRGLTDFISYIYNNKASIFKQIREYDSAIAYYKKAEAIASKEFEKENKRLLYNHMANAYELKGDFENAYKYLDLEKKYQDSIQQSEQNKAMLDIQTKYEVEKKENENLRLKQNRIWLLGALATLLLILLVALLAYKNIRSKKKIIEKEVEVQKQKLENLLKQQELAGIDAMIEGQEKERQRIANDLHDNLGSLLATLKLHFQNMKVRKDRLKEEEDRLIHQTDMLLEEAYQEVRNIAHTKNAGVHAQEGLLPAVKNFASKVSASNKLIIEVEDNGMDERLENSLEILIFRIIQELITNVIKHAEASEASISITHHGDEISIMIEDNGKGFEPANLKPKEGMGIYSIQKRVEHRGGTVDVESIPGKGTSVIINMPVS
ncbi:sensor histidine kinase [Gramella sp. GC03-9]|uniref:Oxygen sensor histidine kinase NreB n=1 Tax=Christiangramia oceanisediminis TaxID=2920386 RepID=A0A9X2KW28_9FLAO|nr:sensor histidine kinase [Gramella oceanisediminis]MCP9199033.1 sensor histidine kinase [Gramella oceanisediminis]